MALALLLLGGCGEEDGGRTTEAKTSAAPVEKPEPKPQNLRPLEITVDGYPNPDYAGLFLAQQRGYFEDAGLDLSIHTPILPSKALPYVAEGTVDLAVAHEPEVVLARERGVPVTAVGALLGRPTTALIWLKKSPIRAVADLAGKTVATEGLPYQESFLQAILAEEGLGLEDVEVATVGYDLTSALESGRVDAIIGGSWNVEGLQMQADGPGPVVVPVADQGIDGYDELVLIARQDRLHRIGDKMRDFISALARGTRAAVEDPDAATELILAENPELSPQATAEGIDVTLPMLSRTGRMDPARWRRFVAWMHDEGLIEGLPPVSQLLSNDYTR